MSEAYEASSPEENQMVHVYPLFGREHVTEGMGCWCQPEPLPDESRVIVHHAEQ